MKYLFRGGTVVSGRGTRRADVLVEDEKILRVARSISAPEATVIDVEGQLLLPGFIDAHTHFDLDVCSTTTADDFFSGSRSALRGGTTTVVDFACPNKGETLHQGLELWHRKADGSCCCDYGFHMTIDDWNPGIEAEIDDMYAAGISSFKMYMTYPAMMIGDEAMYHALKKLREKGGICGVHCENSGVIDALIAEHHRGASAALILAHDAANVDLVLVGLVELHLLLLLRLGGRLGLLIGGAALRLVLLVGAVHGGADGRRGYANGNCYS